MPVVSSLLRAKTCTPRLSIRTSIIQEECCRRTTIRVSILNKMQQGTPRALQHHIGLRGKLWQTNCPVLLASSKVCRVSRFDNIYYATQLRSAQNVQPTRTWYWCGRVCSSRPLALNMNDQISQHNSLHHIRRTISFSFPKFGVPNPVTLGTTLEKLWS